VIVVGLTRAIGEVSHSFARQGNARNRAGVASCVERNGNQGGTLAVPTHRFPIDDIHLVLPPMHAFY
jgi:hypothetical protein